MGIPDPNMCRRHSAMKKRRRRNQPAKTAFLLVALKIEKLPFCVFFKSLIDILPASSGGSNAGNVALAVLGGMTFRGPKP